MDREAWISSNMEILIQRADSAQQTGLDDLTPFFAELSLSKGGLSFYRW
jgi:hypothetical protein